MFGKYAATVFCFFVLSGFSCDGGSAMSSASSDELYTMSDGEVFLAEDELGIRLFRFHTFVQVIPVTYMVDKEGRKVSGPHPTDMWADSTPVGQKSEKVLVDYCPEIFADSQSAKEHARANRVEWIEGVLREKSFFNRIVRIGLPKK